MSRWTCGLCQMPSEPGKRLCSKCRGDLDAQLSLIDLPNNGDARATDPRTSKKAAAANHSARMSQKKLILRRMVEGPVSCHEVADITGGQFGRASKRLGELRDDGLIVECGEIKDRPGGTGRTLYRLTDDGVRDVELMGLAS